MSVAQAAPAKQVNSTHGVELSSIKYLSLIRVVWSDVKPSIALVLEVPKTSHNASQSRIDNLDIRIALVGEGERELRSISFEQVEAVLDQAEGDLLQVAQAHGFSELEGCEFVCIVGKHATHFTRDRRLDSLISNDNLQPWTLRELAEYSREAPGATAVSLLYGGRILCVKFNLKGRV